MAFLETGLVGLGAKHQGKCAKPERNGAEQEISEKGDVAEKENDDQRQGGEQKDLIVRQAKTEDKSRDPEKLIARLSHPAICQQHDEHHEEGAQRIDLDDGRLRPHDGGESENQAARYATGPANKVVQGLVDAMEEGFPRIL